MLNSLTYSVTFPTGRSLSGDLTFGAGMTAISGANEAGKSMVIEIIRFCLFGSEALRGKADDYASLKATLGFTLRGSAYRVERTIKGAKLFNGSLVATGTTPVNKKIVAMLGFGLDVFDVACVANQGDIEKLARLRPAERKRMVDQVIGADKIEDLSKWCGEEGLLLGRESAVLERGLVEPAAPEKPTDCQPSTELEKRVNELRGLQQQLFEFQGWLKGELAKPIEPTDPGGERAEVLQAALARVEATEAERRRLLAIPVYDHDPEEVRKAWEAYDLWQERVRFEREHPRPQYGIDVIGKRIELDAYEAQLRKLNRSPVVTCPCGKPFRVTDQQISDYEFLIAELGEVPKFDAEREMRAHRGWDEQGWQRLKDVPEALQPAIGRSTGAGGMQLAQRDARIAALPAPANPHLLEQALRARRSYDAAKAAYDHQIAVYEQWQQKAKEVRLQVGELQVATAYLPDIEAALRASLAYEQAHARYLKDRQSYDKAAAELAAKVTERQSWLDGKAAFNELRDRVKTHLVPSLSRVASALLSRMTGGARNSIVVDEEFEVTVDGQPHGTLSGSGKACANLALRIGLGQVLTNNVCSLFIGDEVDASMDDDLAGHVQGALESVVGNVKQILIVTHKTPQCEQVVRLQWSSFRGSRQTGAKRSVS